MKIKVVQHVERERMRKSVSVPGSQLLSDVQTFFTTAATTPVPLILEFIGLAPS